IRFSDAKFFVNDWRIVEKQMLFTFSSAALRNQFKGHTSETLCKILRIFYGCRCTDKLRPAAVKRTDPCQPAEHICDMAAKHAAIGMQLVNNDEFQILHQPSPFRVMRQNAFMEHVRIGENKVST